MAIEKGHRFAIDFDDAFPQGLVMVGEVIPDNEYQSREDRAAGRPVRQRIDEVTGKRQWRAAVTDPGETYARLVFGPDLRDKQKLDQVVESRMDATGSCSARAQSRRRCSSGRRRCGTTSEMPT
ncbi:hypothetical protein F9C11_34070 [Amycolatopsis sp. VS8301801F10]|uniref:hypothetical protein n=1 Tax=Amycolatopsis sp. VS8301801F10 TaxID=2652442 RepID=UPI0038FC817F